MVRYSVVIADDDVEVLNSLAQLIESAGHDVVGKTTSGEEAIWMNQTLKPDLVLLDIQMPDVHGLEAAKRMMESRPVAIVICTAHADDQLIMTAAKAGVYAYVVKPCRLQNLLPAMNVAAWRFDENKLLKGEVDLLQEALVARKWIEKAKGVVMEARCISEEAAHTFLQQESQRQSKSLIELAKAIVTAQDALVPKVHRGKPSLSS